MGSTKIKVVAIVQARMGATRFPGKVMKFAAGKPLIEQLLGRLSKSEFIDEIVLATTINSENDVIKQFVSKLGYDVFRGSETDVLDRYYQTAKKYNSDIVVRVTGDCPLIDYQVTDNVIKYYLNGNYDYVSNIDPPSYPDGLDTEVFSFQSLEKAWEDAHLQNDREHVTTFIRESGQFVTGNVSNDVDLSSERWTVDEPEDYELIKQIFEDLGKNDEYFGMNQILSFKKANPTIFEINKNISRNEGASMNSGVKLWKRAKKIIPGGNMLLSKRAEMFLPEKWPAYYSKAKGCKVWDLDGKEYTDMSIMGIGTNILGYGHPEVDEAVHKVVGQGNMSTFNCPEEVYLAERLVELHPWADMVRFARSGGEANTIAMRIARASAGKDKVAICGYHGWHDWYLAANLGDDSSLDGHLLPGLEPKGVPRNLKGTVLPFRYNDFEELESLVNQHPDIGVIKTEVQRNIEPKDGFLEKIRKLATRKNIVLIFDECSSGFRETFGGLHKKYGVEPDIAIFGKALGNGYAISAAIGRREIMESAQSTFISSTFWTERIGPTAGLKTLEVMERVKSWEAITKIGKLIGKRWRKIGEAYGLPIDVGGLHAFINFSIRSSNWLQYKTFITQEMLKQGILASNTIYVCTEHNSDLIEDYFVKLAPLFAIIRDCEEGRRIEKLLDGPVCHSGFGRIN